MQSPNIKYLPAIDHLRFFAASLVVVYHGIIVFNGFFSTGAWVYTQNPVLALFTEGHTAVSLFMVLSGFIFTIGTLGKRVGYAGFVRNRFLRIYPLFIFLIGIGIALYPQNFSFEALIRTVFLMANRPGGLSIGPVSSMFWTIAVEFQFYLLFPIIIYLLNRYGPVAIYAIIVVAPILRAIAFYNAGMSLSDVTFWTLLGRIDQFAIGMLAGRYFVLNNARAVRWKLVLAISIALVLGYSLIFNQLGGWPIQLDLKLLLPIVEGGIWALFIVSYACVVGNSESVASRVLSRLGELSYSMYLIHFIVWYVVYRRGFYADVSLDPVTMALVNSLIIVFPATLAISFATYNLIERPFLRLRRRYVALSDKEG